MFEKEVGDIKVENGKIAEIGFFNEGGVDMSGCLVLPGFVDIHIHGGEGADFSDGDTASFDAMSRYLAKHGVTSFCGTTRLFRRINCAELFQPRRTIPRLNQNLSVSILRVRILQ